MNTRESEEHALQQSLAESAENLHGPASGAPEIDSYRLIFRALKQPPEQQLPADFAASVAARLNYADDKFCAEDWLATLLLLALAVPGLIYLRPLMASISSQVHLNLPSLPLPLLLAAAASVAVAWAVDQGALRLRGRS